MTSRRQRHDRGEESRERRARPGIAVAHGTLDEGRDGTASRPCVGAAGLRSGCERYETVNFIRSYDPETLREIVDESACAERLEDLGVQRSLPALLERVWLLKVLGELEEALEVSEQSVRVARMAGTRKDLLRARILHASVQQYREQFGAAEQELLTVAEEAEGQEWWAVAAFAQQHLGRVYFDMEDFGDARKAFKRALFLRQQAGTPDDQLESTLLAIDAADRRGVETSVAS